MSDDSDFFGEVFDDPENDPLLGGADSSDDAAGANEHERPGPPSWMSDDAAREGAGSGTDVDEGGSSTQKRILVDQQGDAGQGIDAINQAVGQGWRLVKISLARPDGEQPASAQAAHRFVATLEQESPQSLFDFGAPS